MQEEEDYTDDFGLSEDATIPEGSTSLTQEHLTIFMCAIIKGTMKWRLKRREVGERSRGEGKVVVRRDGNETALRVYSSSASSFFEINFPLMTCSFS